MKNRINIFPLVRVLIGGLFVISGTQKLLQSHATFLFVIESYQILPPFLADLTARLLPWIEFFLGLFLILGLWLKGALRGFLGLMPLFILIVGQAILRDLPLQECGCFGDMMAFSPTTILIFDIGLFAMFSILLRNLKSASALSLDSFFQK